MKELFRLSGATHNDPAIAAWFAARPDAQGVLARAWFDQLLRCGPDVRELVHDGCPVACIDDVAFGYVNVFTAHVNVGFFHGAYLDDPAGLLEGAGKAMRHIKLRPDAPADALAMQRLIEDAYADLSKRIDAGIRRGLLV